MSNVIDFFAAKEKKQQPKTVHLDKKDEVDKEIDWSLIEISKVENFISGLQEDLVNARDAKLELTAYHAGLIMAKHISEGKDIEMFWSHDEEFVEVNNELEEALEQLQNYVNGEDDD